MKRGVALYLVGSLVLVALAGCGRNYFFGEREAWRHEAEVACLKSGAIKEGSPTQVRIEPIRGPGMCGADFPLKVAALGDGPALGFSDALRPPAAIPGASQPRWPLREPGSGSAQYPQTQYPQNPQTPYPQPGYSQPQYPAAQTAPQYQSRPLPPLTDTQHAPRGAPRVGAPEISAPMSIAPNAAGPRRTTGGQAEPAGVAEDEDDIPDDAIRPDASRAPSRNAPAARPLATPVPLGTKPAIVTGAVGPVEVKPTATLACPIVSALDQWIVNSVQPAAMRWLGQPVVEIKQISAYSCRGMNGQPGARISEHAFGNALDIASFVLADGRKVTIKEGWYGMPEEQGFLRDIQGAACEQFSTVLAPGSNRFHYDHIHVDLMRRTSGRAACNPRPLSGEVAAARAQQRGNSWARKGDMAVTGSVGGKAAKARGLFGPINGEDYADEDEAEGFADE